MTFSAKNLNACRLYQPQLYAAIANVKRTDRYQIASQRDEIPNLLDRYRKQWFYDTSDPLGAIERDLVDSNIYYTRLAFLAGFGLGYHLLAFNSVYEIHPDTTLVIVERDPEVLLHAFDCVDFGPFMKLTQVHWMVGSAEDTFFPQLCNLLDDRSRRFMLDSYQVIQNATALAAEPQYYQTFTRRLQQAADTVRLLYGNDPNDSLIGIRNAIDNHQLVMTTPGIRLLNQAFAGKPGVVVATGPSLDKQLSLLKEVSDKAVVVAADASLRVLRAHSINPHFVASLERLEHIGELFADLADNDFADVISAFVPVQHPDTVQSMRGNRIVVLRNYAFFDWLGMDHGTLDTGPSSGNMAFSMLEYFGCDPIILIGQDLAYSGDSTHAEGFVHGPVSPKDRCLSRVSVPGNTKPMVESHETWIGFLRAYECAAARYDGTLINATEGGARITGATLMTFRAATEEYLVNPVPVSQIANDRLTKHLAEGVNGNTQTVDQELKRRLQSAYEYLTDIVERLEGFKAAAGQLVTLIQSPEEPLSVNEISKRSVQVRQRLSFLDEPDFRRIAMDVLQSRMIAAFSEIYSNKAAHPAGIEQELHNLTRLRDFSTEASRWLTRLQKILAERL